jgi:hypothetical protein
MVFRLIEKYESIRRSHNSKSTNKKEVDYAVELNQLFDISSCPCYKPKFGKTIDSSTIKSTDCVCENKIPESEWEFYVDQLERRSLFISGSIDKEETEKLKKRERLLERRAERINLHLSKEKTSSNQTQAITEMSNYDHSDQEDEIAISEEDDCGKESRNKSFANHNRNEYPTLISTATRFGIGKRAVCALSNALLDDLGNINFFYLIQLIDVNEFFRRYDNSK